MDLNERDARVDAAVVGMFFASMLMRYQMEYMCGKAIPAREVGAGSYMAVANILRIEEEIQIDDQRHPYHHKWREVLAWAEEHGFVATWKKRHDGIDNVWYAVEVTKATFQDKVRKFFRGLAPRNPLNLA